MKNSYRTALLCSVAILLVVFLPWDRKFEVMGEHIQTTLTFCGYGWLWAPPPPEVAGHPAYSVVPAWGRLGLEFAVFGFLVLVVERWGNSKVKPEAD